MSNGSSPCCAVLRAQVGRAPIDTDTHDAADPSARGESAIEARDSIVARFSGNLELIHQTVSGFGAQTETETQLTRLAADLAVHDDAKDAASIRHAIKGSAGTVGAAALARLSSQLESDLLDGEDDARALTSASAQLPHMQQLLASSVEALTREFAGPAMATQAPADAQPLEDEDWRARLSAIVALLDASNLQAIALSENLSPHAPTGRREDFEEFLARASSAHPRSRATCWSRPEIKDLLQSRLLHRWQISRRAYRGRTEGRVHVRANRRFERRAKRFLRPARRCQRGAHTCLQHGRPDGLGDEIRRARIERLPFGIGIACIGEHDDRHERIRRDQCAHGLTERLRFVGRVAATCIEHDGVGLLAPGEAQGRIELRDHVKRADGFERIALRFGRVTGKNAEQAHVGGFGRKRFRAFLAHAGLRFHHAHTPAKLRAHPRLQAWRDEQLDDVIGRTYAKRIDFERRRIVARNEDHRHARELCIFLEDLADIEARHARQIRVEQDQIRRRFARQSKRGLAGGSKTLIGKFSKHLADDADHRRVVVDEQQARLGAGRGVLCFVHV